MSNHFDHSLRLIPLGRFSCRLHRVQKVYYALLHYMSHMVEAIKGTRFSEIATFAPTHLVRNLLPCIREQTQSVWHPWRRRNVKPEPNTRNRNYLACCMAVIGGPSRGHR